MWFTAQTNIQTNFNCHMATLLTIISPCKQDLSKKKKSDHSFKIMGEKKIQKRFSREPVKSV